MAVIKDVFVLVHGGGEGLWESYKLGSDSLKEFEK